jgi:ketosteroid isomerase-like protein
VSEENLRLVREGFAAMERGDVEAMVELVDPEVEFVNPDYALEAGTRHGPSGYRTALEATLDIFEDFKFNLDEIVDLEDRIVVTGRFVARSKGSGVPIDQPFGHVFTVRDSKLLRHEWYRTPAEAYAAAGIEKGSAASGQPLPHER